MTSAFATPTHATAASPPPRHAEGWPTLRAVRRAVERVRGMRTVSATTGHRATGELDVDGVLAHAIAALTGEPAARAAALLRASDAGNLRFQADFDALAASAGDELQRRIARVALPQAAELESVLAGLGRPLVLACLHAGPYLGGLLRLLPALPGVRNVTLIRRPAACPREARVVAHMRRLGVDCEVLRLAERPLLPARQALRDGRALLTMIDVPPSFLPADRRRQGLAAIRLFGHPAWTPEGPAALAVAASAVVLPVHCSGSPSASVVTVGPLVDAARFAGESRSDATARVHAALVRQMEHWLLTKPADWLLWRHVPSFFVQQDLHHTQRGERDTREAISRPPP